MVIELSYRIKSDVSIIELFFFFYLIFIFIDNIFFRGCRFFLGMMYDYMDVKGSLFIVMFSLRIFLVT